MKCLLSVLFLSPKLFDRLDSIIPFVPQTPHSPQHSFDRPRDSLSLQSPILEVKELHSLLSSVASTNLSRLRETCRVTSAFCPNCMLNPHLLL
jgi:hypothetical protein